MSVEMLNSEPLFKKEMWLLKVFGLSLYKNNSLAYKIYSVFTMFLFIILYPVLDFFELFRHEFEGMASILLYAAAVFVSMIKSVVLYKRSDVVGQIIDALQQPPFKVNYERGGSEEKKLLENCVTITNGQAWAYWIFAYLSLAGGVSYTIVNGLLKHTYDPMYGPISVLNNSNSLNYHITVTYQGISLLYIAAHFTTVDLIIVGILVHATYQFKFLQNNLKRIVANSYRLMCKTTVCAPLLDITNDADMTIIAPKIPWRFLKQNLQEAVSYHLEIVKLVEKLEKLCNVLFLVQFLINLIVLCFQIYNATKTSNSVVQVLSHASEISCVVLQLSVLCYWAEQVIYESDQVGKALFESDFIGTDLRFQKAMILVMRRTQNVTCVTAGKFKTVRLATLMWMMRTSYSAFMMISGAKNPRN